ncbi:uncharacterized protein EV154DRAFT_433135 [Mucor mucedo]|uniref:uncharacterized protein n=1 Tax=Mucor mucedo TaxID=29922 RepID=UPI00221E3A7F|nr:uncharacterized protein EV154DRAFT_433135 [Mucor mucedo]KAI7864299.1 hypothetical protein EV154DRAFT_433135 [Mucor mucedo]
MLLGELTDCTITSPVVFRVTARNVMMECRAIDSGMRVKLFISNPAIMYYFVRYCDVGSRHHFTGPLNVSAYTFDDNTRAFCSVRLSVDAARPLPAIDDDGNIIGTTATRVRVRDLDKNHRFQKLKYIIYNKGLNVEAYALQMHDLYNSLASAGLVADDCNPVSIVESVTRPSTDPTTNRPVPRIVRSLYSYNEGVLRLEGWEHPSLTLRNLLDDSTPFPPSFFALPDPSRGETSEDEN